jgi:hypothetical protein
MLPVPFDLTPKMRAFVEAFVAAGGKHQERAAIAAGYSPPGAAAIASRLLRRDDVLAYLKHVVETRVRAGIVKSVEVLEQLRDDTSISPDVRRKCAETLLGHGGMLIAKVNETHITVEDQRPEAQIASIIEMCKRQGLDPRAVLGAAVDFYPEKQLAKLAPPAIDAEFDQAEPEPNGTAQTGRQEPIADVEPIADETGRDTDENPLPEDDLSDLL